MKKTKKLGKPHGRLPDRSSELLVNHRILYAVRDELKADIRSLEAMIKSMSAKMDSHAQEAMSDRKRMIALFEEQNHRNKTVLEGYQQVYDRMDRSDKRQDEFDHRLSDLKKFFNEK